MNVIKVRNASKSFDANGEFNRVLDKLNMNVHRGSM
jgi:ABC-type glutathione transport system ATPase component